MSQYVYSSIAHQRYMVLKRIIHKVRLQHNDALFQHLERSVFQASICIWTSAHKAMMPAMNHIYLGWLERDGNLVPKWVTLTLARDVINLDVKCTCTLSCSSCKGKKANLKCSRLSKHKCTM